jgi:hypothetical protein
MTRLAKTDNKGRLPHDPETTSAEPTDGANALFSLTRSSSGVVVASDDCPWVSNTLSGTIGRAAGGGGTTIYLAGRG